MNETIPAENEIYNRDNEKFKKLILKKILTESEINYLVKNYYPSYDSSDSSDDSAEEDQDIDEEPDKQVEEGVAEPKPEEKPSVESVLETKVCDICNKEFKAKYYLKLHKENVHLKIRKFVCDHQGCDRKFSTKQILLNHKKNIHQNEVKVFKRNESKSGKKSAKGLNLKIRFKKFKPKKLNLSVDNELPEKNIITYSKLDQESLRN